MPRDLAQWRIVFYVDQRGRSHAYRKQGQKAPAHEIAIAEKRMAEVLEE